MLIKIVSTCLFLSYVTMYMASSFNPHDTLVHLCVLLSYHSIGSSHGKFCLTLIFDRGKVMYDIYQHFKMGYLRNGFKLLIRLELLLMMVTRVTIGKHLG